MIHSLVRTRENRGRSVATRREISYVESNRNSASDGEVGCRDKTERFSRKSSQFPLPRGPSDGRLISLRIGISLTRRAIYNGFLLFVSSVIHGQIRGYAVVLNAPFFSNFSRGSGGSNFSQTMRRLRVSRYIARRGKLRMASRYYCMAHRALITGILMTSH